jgi:phosphoglycolate phosphatase
MASGKSRTTKSSRYVVRAGDGRSLATSTGARQDDAGFRASRALKREQLDAVSLFSHAPAMLHTLRDAGLTLTLVSSDTEDNALRQLGESAALFSHFACGASIFGKAAKFKAVMRRARVTPAQTIAIGDEVRDIEAARAAGIACGAATWGYSATDALIAMKPDMVFQNMNDISVRLAPP